MDERKELIEKIIALLEQADDIQLRMIYYMLLNKRCWRPGLIAPALLFCPSFCLRYALPSPNPRG